MELRVSDLAAEYVELRSRRHELAKNTRTLTRSVLGIFARAIGDPPAGQLTRQHVEAWIARENVAPGTLRGRLSIVRGFCQWLVICDYLDRDPTLGIKGPRQPRTLPRVLAPESVGRTLDACPNSRARLIIQLMVQEGLRAHEVTNLEYGDIDEVNRLVHVVGKFGAHRVLPLTDEAFRCLRRYLAEYPPIQGPLIRSFRQPNKGIGPHYVSTLVSAWMQAAGVKQRPRDGVSGHALRRTAATEVADASKDPRAVQSLLGHKTLATVHPYLARMQAEQLRAVMEGRTYRDPPTAREPPSEEDGSS